MENLVNRIELSDIDICPDVVYTSFFDGIAYRKSKTRTEERLILDYELEVFTRDGGIAIFNDTEYPISKGDCIFRRPGELWSSVMTYQCQVVLFDMTGTLRQPSQQVYTQTTPRLVQPNYKNRFIDEIPSYMHLIRYERYLELIDHIQKAFINPYSSCRLFLRSCSLALISMLYEDSLLRKNQTGTNSVNINKYVEEAAEFIRSNYSRKINLEVISREVCLSANYLHRIFTNTYKTTPQNYLMQIRLENSKKLLAGSNLKITEISSSCGFDNASYFIQFFKKCTGRTPSQFRKSYLPYY